MLTNPRTSEDLRRSHRADVGAGIFAHAKRLRWSKEQLDAERQEKLRQLAGFRPRAFPVSCRAPARASMSGISPKRCCRRCR